MGIKFVLLILVVVELATITQAGNYCHIETCENRSHTLCKYQRFTASSNCKNVISVGLTEDEKQTILNLHNIFRDVVYSGWEFRGHPGPQHPSINNATMEWDAELATIAQMWALNCKFNNDECRNVKRFNVSQSVALRSIPKNSDEIKVDWILYDWQNEVSKFQRDGISSYRPNNSTSNYSQMVWAVSTRIGCGGIRFYDNSDVSFYLVCNYGAAGNIEGEPVYRIDEALSEEFLIIANFLNKFT